MTVFCLKLLCSCTNKPKKHNTQVYFCDDNNNPNLLSKVYMTIIGLVIGRQGVSSTVSLTLHFLRLNLLGKKCCSKLWLWFVLYSCVFVQTNQKCKHTGVFLWWCMLMHNGDSITEWKCICSQINVSEESPTAFVCHCIFCCWCITCRSLVFVLYSCIFVQTYLKKYKYTGVFLWWCINRWQVCWRCIMCWAGAAGQLLL